MMIIKLLQNNPNITLIEIAKSFNKEVSWVRSQRRSMSKYVEMKREGSRKKGKWKIVLIEQNK